MDFGIGNRAAVILASSRGLGRASAEALAAEGCRLAICARTKADIERAGREIERAHGRPVMAEAVDVEKRGDLRAFLEAAAKRLGGVEILVTNCGGPPPGRPLELPDEAWDAAVASTLMVAVHAIRAVAPAMVARKWGRIVNITSIAVKQPVDNLILSNTMRTGVVGFAKTMSRELAPHGITVNNVCPGLILTDRVRDLAGARAKESGVSVDEALRRMAAEVPLARLGAPEEVGALIAFLASEPARYITGATIQVDGGAYRGLM